ncbi:MAG: CCA tRNA nucleotidyltransferase [Acidobacteria bacterium]|nr:CCA tRNA nucleotidyltransferase [Acidobacteriota bacterium]
MALESSRDIAFRIAAELQAAGHLAYWVGGCVRDRQLGREPKDYDIATSALPDQVLALIPGTQMVGASFGVALAPGNVEIATFRSESAYTDGRRPDQVIYETDPALDAARRDFTINALYFDPVRNQLHDFTGGLSDLKEGILRAIGDPSARFEEDHLRLLRAIRFAVRFRYTIEQNTFDAIRSQAPNISRIAGERLHEEMRLILTGSNLDLAWQLLNSTGLLNQLLPERKAGERLQELQTPASLPLAWAALLEGMPDTRSIYGRFRFSREEAEQCQDLLDCEREFLEIANLPIAELKRFVRKRNFSDHLALYRAKHDKEFPALPAWTQKQLWPEPLLNGDDLLALGLAPGPQFRDILTALETAQLEDRIHTRDQALALAQSSCHIHREG